MKNYQLPKVPENVQIPFTAVCNILANLCKNKLNEEYFQVSVKLAAKIARKRRSPLLTGNANTWAAGIVHAIGLVNFLLCSKYLLTSNPFSTPSSKNIFKQISL